ncbi:MAG: DNA/RNA non-specific endonuclease [Oligoflexia bacterium]|nr:DNA/RNA non-specific endonuclease [Oligoflexia bacterium]
MCKNIVFFYEILFLILNFLNCMFVYASDESSIAKSLKIQSENITPAAAITELPPVVTEVSPATTELSPVATEVSPATTELSPAATGLSYPFPAGKIKFDDKLTPKYKPKDSDIRILTSNGNHIYYDVRVKTPLLTIHYMGNPEWAKIAKEYVQKLKRKPLLPSYMQRKEVIEEENEISENEISESEVINNERSKNVYESEVPAAQLGYVNDDCVSTSTDAQATNVQSTSAQSELIFSFSKVMKKIKNKINVGKKIKSKKRPKFSAEQSLVIEERINHQDLSDKTNVYSRGHLTANGDFDEEDLRRETFMTTNVSPQVQKTFNEGIWNNLEACSREWSTTRKGLTILTGVIHDDLKTAKKLNDLISIPTHFYKIIIDETNQPLKVIAFLMENRTYNKSERSLAKYIVKVEDIEKMTGIKFLISLPEDVRSNLVAKKESMWSGCSKR